MKYLALFFSICVLSFNGMAQENKLQDEPTEDPILTTPALYPQAPSIFTCSLTNVSSHCHDARIRIFDGDGREVADSGKLSLDGRHTKGVDHIGSRRGGYMYCQFSVNGPKGEFRGVAKMYKPNGIDFIAVQAY